VRARARQPPLKLVLTHVKHAATGGTERVLDHLATRWSAAGHEVTVLCRTFDDAAAARTGARFVRLHSPTLGAAHRHIVFGRDVARWLARERGNHDAVLGLGRTWTQDVLRLGGGCHATFVEALAPLARLRPKHRLLLSLERRVLSPSSARLFVANAVMVRDDVCARYGLPPERVRVVHNGVDLERFHPARRAVEGARVRTALGLPPDAPVVLFLGTGFARKGLGRVLRAFPAVRRAVPGAVLVVVGHDTRQAAYEAEAARLGLADATHFAGRRVDAEAWFAAGDCYVLPTAYDPFANSTLEALAAGLPVVTTRTNGGHELIDAGVQGSVLADADDAAELAAALVGWLDPARAGAARAAARARAEEHPIEAKLDQLLELLREARGGGLR